MMSTPSVIRPVAVVALLGLALVHFLAEGQGFPSATYSRVGVFVALMAALAGAMALLADDRNAVWWGVLALGAANTLVGALGWVAAASGGAGWARRVIGMDVERAGEALRLAGTALGFGGVVIATMAVSVLWGRRRARAAQQGPVTSARERALLLKMYGPPPQRPDQHDHHDHDDHDRHGPRDRPRFAPSRASRRS